MKRVIFILLALMYTRAWALDDVTVLKEDVTALIKKLEDANESIRQEAKKQLMVDGEPVSVASGTVVGVLGSDYGCLLGEDYSSDYNPDSVYVVLPDSRTVYVDDGILERIRPEDEQDR